MVGSQNSSNSNRLRELGERSGRPSHLIDASDQIDPSWFHSGARIGVTAGASAPESLVQQVLGRLRGLGVRSVTELDGEPETITFKLPEQLTPGTTAPV